MTGHRTQLKGYRLDKKTGRLVRCLKHLDVSTRLKKQSSKAVRVVKPTAAS